MVACQNAGIGFALEVWIANVAVHAYTVGPFLRITTSSKFSFALASLGCERDLAIRVEAQRAIKLKRQS